MGLLDIVGISSDISTEISNHLRILEIMAWGRKCPLSSEPSEFRLLFIQQNVYFLFCSDSLKAILNENLKLKTSHSFFLWSCLYLGSLNPKPVGLLKNLKNKTNKQKNPAQIKSSFTLKQGCLEFQVKLTRVYPMQNKVLLVNNGPPIVLSRGLGLQSGPGWATLIAAAQHQVNVNIRNI